MLEAAVAEAMTPDFLNRVAAAERRDESRASSPLCSAKASETSQASTTSSKEPSDAKKKRSATTATGASPAKPPAKRAAASGGKGATPAKGGGGAAKGGASSSAAKGGAAKAVPGKADPKEKGPARNVNVKAEIKQFGFEYVGPIAAGAFSTIVKAKHSGSSTEVAVKTFATCTGTEQENQQRELEVLRLLRPYEHAHVANLMGEYDTSSGTHAILHYCGGGSLLKYLAKLRNKQMAMREEDAAVVTAQMASALGFLHSIGVAHRDVKPGNVLYDGRRWRLCDYGFAVVCHEEGLKDKCGTLAYTAPEILAGKTYNGASVDQWAFGCMLYEMRIGRTCFVAPDEESLRLRIKNGFKGGTESQPWLPHLTKAGKGVITNMLAKEPEKRLTCEQVLKSKWVTEFCKPTENAAELGGGGAGGAGAGGAPAVIPWWCDVAGSGCLRPVEGSYPHTHQCWAYNGSYMVCEVCYASGAAEHYDKLQAIDSAGNVMQPQPPKPTQQQPTPPPPPVAMADARAAAAAAPDATGAATAADGAEAAPLAPAPISELETELYALKEKHGAGSRLEACMIELSEQRFATASAHAELQEVKEQLAESNRKLEELSCS